MKSGKSSLIVFRSLISAWLLVFLCSYSYAQESLSLMQTDYDETVTNTHLPHEQADGVSTGVYQTKYLLYRVTVNDLLPLSQDSQDILLEELPSEIELLLGEHRYYKEYFAKGHDNAGSSYETIETERNGIIYPSLYYLDPNRSYQYFRGDSETNHLKQTLRESLDVLRASKDKNTMAFGVAFPLLVLSMTPNPVNPDTPLIHGGVITAGGFPDHHVEEFRQYFAKELGIENPTPFSLGWDSLALSKYGDLSYFQVLAEKKWLKIKSVLDRAEKTPIDEDAIQRRHPYNPKLKARMHYYLYAEDNIEVYNYVLDKLRRAVANQQYRNVKVGLMCSASRPDWENAIVPKNAMGGIFRNMILKPDGTSRPMTKEEYLGEPLVYKDSKKQKAFEKKLQKQFNSSCNLAFSL